MSDTKPIIVKATIMYPFFDKKNQMSDKYQVDLCNLSQAACEKLAEVGIDARFNEDKPDKGMHITCKSGFPFRPLDMDKEEIDLDVVKIGNGSECKAVIEPYEWKYKNKSGVSPNLRKLVVTKLIEYVSADDGVDLDEEEAL